jgi:hypothetical protein
MLGRSGIGGIPVTKLESNGPSKPQRMPKRHPQIKPHSKTGICIGINILPAFCTEWNAIGKTTHKAMQTAVMIDFFTLDISPIWFPL